VRSGLEEEDPDRIRSHAVVARHDVPAELRQRTRHLDPGRAAADDHEREERARPHGVGRRDGVLERAQDVVPERAGVLEVVEAERVLADAGDAEVGRRCPRSRR
jgi:hypothetical protein